VKIFWLGFATLGESSTIWDCTDDCR